MGRGDDLSQVGAAPDDGKDIRSALNRLDKGRLVALIGEDDDPVDGAHGAPTGTAASSSVEDCAARRTGMDWAFARISIRWPRCDWDEASIRRTKVNVPSISRLSLRARGDRPQPDPRSVRDAIRQPGTDRDGHAQHVCLRCSTVPLRQIRAHDDLAGGNLPSRDGPHGSLRRANVDVRVDAEDNLADIVRGEGFPRGDGRRRGVDAASSPQEAAESTECDHGRDDEDQADDESTVHLAGGARRDRH